MPDVRHDDGLGRLVAPGPCEAVASGLIFTEGPVWHPDGYLLFSDINASRIYRWRDGALDIYREPSWQSNGLTLDPTMSLVSCEHEGRRVSRERDGALEALATAYDGKRLNSPNDVIARSDGRIFFTDPPYGITEEQRELPYNGVFTISPTGELTLLASDFDRPNGLALSPDERTLYVADTSRHHVRAFDVGPDGALSNGRVFAQMRDDGRPDGMKVDRDGQLWVCAAGIEVFDASGRPLGNVDVPQRPANCAWGEDGSTLFVCARTAVYRMRTSARGVGPAFRAGTAYHAADSGGG
ncbi:MAG TPA: SMP-30/gluconolactonase/LRE family protein [Dehalococcoidia bacterium]|nr:SMP-30/gluconolactonase/LRE family protein [Dehalococcoidia bacterium]